MDYRKFKLVKQIMEQDKKFKSIVLIGPTKEYCSYFLREIAEELGIKQNEITIVSGNKLYNDGIDFYNSIVLLMGSWWENKGINKEWFNFINRTIYTTQIKL